MPLILLPVAQLHSLLQDHDIPITDPTVAFATSESSYANATDVGNTATSIMDGLLSHPASVADIQQWACRTASQVYAGQIVDLSRKAAGPHFGASKATALSLQEFNLDDLTNLFQSDTPDLWRCYDQLLSADPSINRQRERRQQQRYETRLAVQVESN
ncbi:hypothetical protein BDN71DRAFT_1495344 [Pleurotus eryngii]|uniref:Uncharacterized protein n=1 Tax=Pleurotus eryngii TaxID=5323 RepID=A0A9P5ZZ86_PLEER|nr:hypothetical protein BDN71DRAFT_1495344 [Pleurotus eryngii]